MRWTAMWVRAVVAVWVLTAAMPALADVNCNVDGVGGTLPNVGDASALLPLLNAGGGVCANGACNFDGQGDANVPTQGDLTALMDAIATNDATGLCIPSLALTGTLEADYEPPPGRAASRTVDRAAAQVTVEDLQGNVVSVAPGTVDGFSRYTVRVPQSGSARNLIVVATAGANKLRTVVENVTTTDKDAGRIDFTSDLVARVYKAQGGTTGTASLRSTIVTNGYGLDGVAHTQAAGDTYVQQVRSCIENTGCTIDNAQPRMAFQVMENNYIATYLFAFAYSLYDEQSQGTGRTAAMVPTVFTPVALARAASITCGTGEVTINENICFDAGSGLRIENQPIEGMSCVVNGTINSSIKNKPLVINGVTRSSSYAFSNWKGTLFVTQCADVDLLENGTIDVDIAYATGGPPVDFDLFTIKYWRDNSIIYQSSTSSMNAKVLIPYADSDIPLGAVTSGGQNVDLESIQIAGQYQAFLHNEQADLKILDGTFDSEATGGKLLDGTLTGTTRDGSTINIPFIVDGSGILTLKSTGTVTLSGGGGTITYSTTNPDHFKFQPQQGGGVVFAGPQGSIGTITYSSNGSGSGTLNTAPQAGNQNIGQLSWTELTKRATFLFGAGAALPPAEIYVMNK